MREWLKQPSQAQIMAFQILELQNDQTRALVNAVEVLCEAQTKQAEAHTRQIQAILDVWNQPTPARLEPIRSVREQELLRDLRLESKHNSLADEMLKPENAEQLEEYLALFRES